MKMEQLNQQLTDRGLTLRQREVAILTTMGLSNCEIGNQLFITEKTVKFHLINIYSILNLKSRAQLIVFCLPFTEYGRVHDSARAL